MTVELHIQAYKGLEQVAANHDTYGNPNNPKTNGRKPLYIDAYKSKAIAASIRIYSCKYDLKTTCSYHIVIYRIKINFQQVFHMYRYNLTIAAKPIVGM